MTLITFQDGKPVLRDGKVGTEQACCCVEGEECSGPCEFDEDCAPGCVCIDGQCVGDPCNSPTKEIWNDCVDCPEDENGFVDCGTFCIPVGTGPPDIPGYTPCGAWTLAAFALDDCIPCGNNPLP